MYPNYRAFHKKESRKIKKEIKNRNFTVSGITLAKRIED